MKKKLTKSRFLAIVLAAIMTVCMMPAVTFAAEDTPITATAVTVNMPSVGDSTSVAPVITLPLGANYFQYSDAHWYPTTGVMGATFEEGRTYELSFYLKPNTGYSMDDSTTCTVNGAVPQRVEWNNDMGYLYINLTFEMTEGGAQDTTITGITVNSSTHKTAYYVGESLDVTNLTIEATKSDTTKETIPVTAGMVSGFNSLTATASQTLTITYEGRTTTYNISVSDVTVTGIAVNSSTHKTAYYVGDTLDVTNLSIEVTNSDTTKETIPVTAGMVSGFNSVTAAASQTLTITYGGQTTTYNISVSDVTVTGIAVNSSTHKTAYIVGESLDVTNLSILVTKSNSSTETVAVTAGMVSGFNSTTAAASQTLTITYEGQTATYNISIEDATVTGIAVNSSTHKTAYYVGDTLDVTNLSILATKSNSTSSTLPVNASMVSGFNSATATPSQTLTITYGGQTTTYNISIANVTVTGIAINSSTHKTAYYVGDTLDVTNLSILATKSNSSTETVAVTAGMVSGFNSTTEAASQTLTITYEGQTTTFNISIGIKYNMNSGASQEIKKGDEAVFVSEANFADFVGVKVDGTLIHPNIDYTAVSGSTKITLTDSYTSTLSTGSHDIEIVSTNGTATASFTVMQTNTGSDTPSPQGTQTGTQSGNNTSTSATVQSDNQDDNAEKLLDQNVPKTGDSGNMLWLGIMCMALLGLAVTLFGKKRIDSYHNR